METGNIKTSNMDEKFREQALQALMSIGLPEDEAEMAVDDYLDDTLIY